MFITTVAVSVVLAALLAVSAVRKLGHQEQVVATYVRVGVPEARLNLLAAVLLAGAAGLLAGLAWAPLGVAAAAALTVYFAVAAAFHVRADDAAHLPMPVALGLLSAAATALRLATA
jgi:DoxX-like family